MNFTVSAWNAVSPYHQTPRDWWQWFHDSKSECTVHTADLSFLPAMKRRRLSHCAKWMFAAAWPLLKKEQYCPTVFVSHDGEINRSFELWQMLLRDGVVSPASFGLSVHNAVVGQWSMMRHDMHESIALSCKHDGLEIGVLEACALLQDGVKQVLVVVTDDPLHVDYDLDVERAPFPYALAMVLEQGSEYHLNYYNYDNDIIHNSIENHYYTSALNWIKNQVNQNCDWRNPTEQGYWQWQKN